MRGDGPYLDQFLDGFIAALQVQEGEGWPEFVAILDSYCLGTSVDRKDARQLLASSYKWGVHNPEY